MKRFLYVFAALLLMLGIGSSWVAWKRWQALDKAHEITHLEVFRVEPGESATGIFHRLQDLGLIRDPGGLVLRLKWRGEAGIVQAGEYLVEGPASDLEIAQMMIEGRVLLHTITIPEGLRFDEIAALFGQAGLLEADVFKEAATDPALIADHDSEAPDLEGYLFPETYRFPSDITVSRVIPLMVERFLESVGDDYSARAEAVGLSLREAVTLASMIEEETSVQGERKTISRVFHNRLSLGMRMQCDPTVRYAWYREGELVTRLLYKHLELDSPWNTYVVYGLPAGPIVNPGLASLEAAVAPAEGSELYFVAAPGGGHVFSKTLVEHERAVRGWRRYVRSSR